MIEDELQPIEPNNVDDNGWTSSAEEAMIIVKNACISYKWMHNKTASTYTRRHKILENVVTALGLLTSASVFSTSAFCDDTLWVRILTGAIMLFVTFIARHHSWANYQYQAREHKYISGRWNSLYLNISTQLILIKNQRQNARDYMNWINGAYSHLLEISPDINNRVHSEYTKLFPTYVKVTEVEIKVDTDAEDKKIEQFHKFQFDSSRTKYELDRFFMDNVV